VRALDGAAMLAILQGDYARAARFLDEGERLAAATADPVLLGEALAYAGYLAYRQGDYAQAERQLEAGLERLRGVADSGYGAFALLILGDAALAQERFDPAANAYQGAIARFRQAGYAWGLSDAQAGLAGVRFCAGDLAGALTDYRESFERARALGFPMYVASALFGLAAIAAVTDRAVAGAHLLGAGEGMIAALGAPLFPRDQPIRARGLAALQAALGAPGLEAARVAGQRLAPAEVASLADGIAVASAAAAPVEDAADPLHSAP
jgi:tetratricopeptide (TPR) repeat protein